MHFCRPLALPQRCHSQQQHQNSSHASIEGMYGVIAPQSMATVQEAAAPPRSSQGPETVDAPGFMAAPLEPMQMLSLLICTPPGSLWHPTTRGALARRCDADGLHEGCATTAQRC